MIRNMFCFFSSYFDWKVDMIWYIDEYVLMYQMLLLFVIKSNACLGIDFVLFIFDIFVISLDCLVLY